MTIASPTSPIQINKWNIQEVRVAFDDSVVQFMNEELKFKEDNSLIILKLVVYFFINLIGVATGLYGYLVKPFSETRLLVGIGSAIYLALTGIWTLILQYRITHTVYRGMDGKGKIIWLRSSLAYPQAIYRLEVILGGRAGRGADDKKEKVSFEVNVGDWIDVDGNLRSDLIVKDLKSGLVPKFKFD